MNWKKALGFGVLIWVAVFIVISILVAFKVVPPNGGGTVFEVFVGILALVLFYVAARYVAPTSLGMAFWYGLVFAVVGVVLDYFISQKFAPDMFQSVVYWVSYLLGIFVPMLAVKKTGVVQ